RARRADGHPLGLAPPGAPRDRARRALRHSVPVGCRPTSKPHPPRLARAALPHPPARARPRWRTQRLKRGAAAALATAALATAAPATAAPATAAPATAARAAAARATAALATAALATAALATAATGWRAAHTLAPAHPGRSVPA